MGSNSKYRYKPPANVSNEDEFVFTDPYLESNCKCLYDLMARQMVDGKKVKPVSLSFFAQEGKLTACLNWDCQSLILFVSVECAESAFDDVEAKLAKPEPGWRKKKERRY